MFLGDEYMKVKREDYEEFLDFGASIINHSQYQRMKDFVQHGKVTCYDHSIDVALRCFVHAKRKKKDYRSITRGALLHDFFLYDWHDKNKGFHFHGYKHPKIAYGNAARYFILNDIERDIILKHMFPLTLFHIPRYKESIFVCLVDKYVSLKEIFRRKTKVVLI